MLLLHHSAARPERLVVDYVNKKIYYTDQLRGHIGQLDMAGGGQNVVIQGLDQPTGIAIDVLNGYPYCYIIYLPIYHIY